tara:strand:- start:429 stop:791 length:363 start_codon:yes stop_codon:yes gene_type:complete
MKITRRQLRRLIKEERQRILLEGEKERMSEMREFSNSKSGKKVAGAGGKISSAANVISEVADDQTGTIRKTLYNISEFVGKVGESLSGIGYIQEGGSVTDNLPSIQELRQLHRDIQKLEK